MSNEVSKEELVQRIKTEVVDFHGAALDSHIERGIAEGKRIIGIGIVQPLPHFPAQTHIVWGYWGPSFEKELADHDANADPNTPAPYTPPVPTAEEQIKDKQASTEVAGDHIANLKAGGPAVEQSPALEAPETPLVPQPHSDPHAEAGPATVESGEVSGSIIDALKDAPPAE